MSYPRDGWLIFKFERDGSMNKYIFDPETGEILDEVMPGDRILRKNSIEFLKNKDEEDDGLIEINKGRPFIKLYDDVAEDLAKEKLNSSEFAVLLQCINHLSYVSGLAKRKNSDEPLTPIFFEKALGLTKPTVLAAIAGLIEKEIILRGETGERYQLYLNPYIFMKGRKINKTLFEMFKNTKWYRKHKWELEVGEY